VELLALVKKAYQENKVKELLLGEEDFFYCDRFAPIPRGVKTDLASVIPAGLHKYKKDDPEMEKKLLSALISLSDNVLGIWVVASFILIEVLCRKENLKEELNIDLNDLANHLKNKIIEHKEGLYFERSILNGDQHSDGVLGELRRLQLNTFDEGGPQFLPDELLQKK